MPETTTEQTQEFRVAGSDVIRARSHQINVIRLSRCVYRKITLDNFHVKNDSDVLSDGEFVFQLDVNGVSLGRSEEIRAASNSDLNYKWVTAVKHDPGTSSDPQAMQVTFRIDEIDVLFDDTIFASGEDEDWHLTNESQFGVPGYPESTSEVKEFENDKIKFRRTIEYITSSDYLNISQVSGTITDSQSGDPVSGAVVAVFLKDDKRRDIDQNATTAQQIREAVTKKNALGWVSACRVEGKNVVHYARSGSDGTYTIPKLDLDYENVSYVIKVIKKGYGVITHEINRAQQEVDFILHKRTLVPRGRVVRKGTSQAIAGSDVRLYKLFVKIITGSTEGRRVYTEAKAEGTPLVTLPQNHYCEIVLFNDNYPNFGTDFNSSEDFIKIRFEYNNQVGEGWIRSRNGNDNYAIVCSHFISMLQTGSDGTFEFPEQTGRYFDFKVRKIENNNAPGHYYDTETSWFDFYTRDKDGIEVELEHDNLESLIDEDSLASLFPTFYNWTYGSPPDYPWQIPNSTWGGYINNNQSVCCSFVHAFLVRGWETYNEQHDIGWQWGADEDEGNNRNKQANCRKNTWEETIDEYAWGSVNVYNAKDMANGLYTPSETSNNPIELLPKPWTVMQGHPSNSYAGHNIIILDVHKYSGRVMTVECAGNGPQFNFSKDPVCRQYLQNNQPGQYWYGRLTVNTWEKMKEFWRYNRRRLARLRVHNLTFVEHSNQTGDNATPVAIRNGEFEGS